MAILFREIGEEIFFVFYFDAWPGARILAVHLISQHTIHWSMATSSNPDHFICSQSAQFGMASH